ncbi:cytochrome b [Aliiglaciecola sp. LCG003]|uniref:cytochrome b n=1 Tax=Aliiglaciecola sp. LCG003 TaxID=3053655 RepID=UPI002572EC7C|nr:cytochrome b [Aliiglaciecola sp. LCG003]WJG10789.1 cytochrome b [Aliiglaciecola sp. LCG003]
MDKIAFNGFNRYSLALHWLMALLLAAVYGCIELREMYPKGSDPRELLKTWHFMLGLSVFVLVWLRLLARLVFAKPQIIPAPPVWQRYLASTMYIAFYLIMIGMPLGGWLILSAEGKVVPFYGLELPTLIAPDKDLGHTIEEIHQTVGTVGYYLIGLHTLAAFYHHYFRGDNTLQNMLPNWLRR